MAPPVVEFAGLTFSIRTKDGQKELLHGVSGRARGLTSLEGPSGSGKTTLLDLLAGATYGGQWSGTITVNGQRLEEWCSKNSASYVMQHDVLPTCDTVREAITTSALLRLPASMSREEKLDRVEQALDVLDLHKVADLVIGDATEGLRGISGGQRRRVTIGIELVKDPQLIFLDEPLSGLDSEMAEQVMQCLARLVEKGKTVVISMHQTSKAVQDMIDNLVLLCSGSVAFCGPHADAADFVASLGYKKEASQTRSEFMLSALKDPSAQEQAVKAFAERKEAGSDLEKGTKEAAPNLTRKLTRSVTLVDEYRSESSSRLFSITMLFQQFWVLTARHFRWLIRERVANFSVLATTTFTGLLLGLVFFGMSDDLSPGANQRRAALWIITTACTLLLTNQTIAGWQKERRLFRREYTTRLYTLPAFFLARTIKWLVWVPMLAISFDLCAYFMPQFQINAARFFIFLGAQLLLAYTAQLLGSIIAFLTPDGVSGYALQSAIVMLLMCSSGFLNPDIPSFLRWVQKSSFLTYSYSSLVQNEFTGLTLAGPNGTDVYFSTAPPEAVASPEGWGLGANVGMQAAILGAFWVVAYFTLWAMTSMRRF